MQGHEHILLFMIFYSLDNKCWYQHFDTKVYHITWYVMLYSKHKQNDFVFLNNYILSKSAISFELRWYAVL